MRTVDALDTIHEVKDFQWTEDTYGDKHIIVCDLNPNSDWGAKFINFTGKTLLLRNATRDVSTQFIPIRPAERKSSLIQDSILLNDTMGYAMKVDKIVSNKYDTACKLKLPYYHIGYINLVSIEEFTLLHHAAGTKRTDLYRALKCVAAPIVNDHDVIRGFIYEKRIEELIKPF